MTGHSQSWALDPKRIITHENVLKSEYETHKKAQIKLADDAMSKDHTCFDVA